MDKKATFSILFLFIAGFLLYANSFKGSFHFDDYAFIVNNRALREIGNLKGIWDVMGVPTRFVALYSFAINYQIHGLNVVGFHVTNTLIHCLTAVSIFILVRLVLSVPKMQESLEAKSQLFIPLLAALIFIAHPIQTQAVTYISQRFASLASLFYVAALIFYLKARLITEESKRRGVFIFLCFLSGLLGMFTKEIVITLPLMIIFVECFLFGGGFIRQHKLLFVGLGMMILLIPAMFNFQVMTMFFAPRPSESHPGDIITYVPYLLTQVRVLFIFSQSLHIARRLKS